uniref:endoplasmic reticulum junction formation protein lunapark-B-like n=1 Tax=Styela clava TaxID=7725 RepID=UPI00193ABD93|nr:endoplasmic reticulum junction formation protein lunapark-B-like [Styela clava]
MGAIIARFRKSPTTIEILEDIDKNIAHLEKFRKANQELRQKVIGKLILYSVVLYIVGAVALYFFFMPQELTYKIYGLSPFFLFPFLVYLLKRFLHWFFVRKISQNEGEMQALKDKRKDILENVMETETYKKAKEILEKFDPETKKKLEEEKNRKDSEANAATSPPQQQHPGLRRRQVPGQSEHPGAPGAAIGRGRGIGSPLPLPNMQQTPMNGAARGQPIVPRSPVAVLPRPILPLNKTTMDKLMDYMIGDGTAHRYSLICQNCCNHNGMALKEEFQYLAFRCAYCRFFNPARKQRPNAPRLPMTPPRRIEPIQGTANNDDDGNNESDKPSTSSTPESENPSAGTSGEEVQQVSVKKEVPDVESNADTDNSQQPSEHTDAEDMEVEDISAGSSVTNDEAEQILPDASI